MALTRHHLIPRSRHDKGRIRREYDKDYLRSRVAMLCRPCHSACHRAVSAKQMAEGVDTVERLRAVPEISKFVNWISTKPGGFRPK